MAQVLIFNIQKFSIHDGDGIRTTVFFKGCPLRCAWCHNPESQAFTPQWMHYPERCRGCGRCAQGCPFGALEPVGKHYTVEALFDLLMRDRIFFDASGGGVTLSGGEPMAQDPAYLLALCQRLTRRGVRVSVDTCGYAPYAHFSALLPYVETFLYDIKAIDPGLHARYTGVDNALILDNLKRLSGDGANINLRVPVIPGVNAEPLEMERILRFVKKHVQADQVNLLPYHRLGMEKADRLSHLPIKSPSKQASPAPPSFEEPTEKSMQGIAALWQAAGFHSVSIGG